MLLEAYEILRVYTWKNSCPFYFRCFSPCALVVSAGELSKDWPNSFVSKKLYLFKHNFVWSIIQDGAKHNPVYSTHYCDVHLTCCTTRPLRTYFVYTVTYMAVLISSIFMSTIFFSAVFPQPVYKAALPLYNQKHCSAFSVKFST